MEIKRFIIVMFIVLTFFIGIKVASTLFYSYNQKNLVEIIYIQLEGYK